MGRLKVTEPALEDLGGIWDYIAQDNPVAADRVIDSIYTKGHQLADSPGIGRPRPHLGSGVRGVPVGNYILLYRGTSAGIQLLRVIHGRRDVERVFRSGER